MRRDFLLLLFLGTVLIPAATGMGYQTSGLGYPALGYQVSGGMASIVPGSETAGSVSQMAISDVKGERDLGDKSDKYLERCYPYEHCESCDEKHYGDGYCDECGERCTCYEHCPRCNFTYRTTTYADGKCDRCGGDASIMEKCDKCGHSHTYDGICDKCGEKASYNRCCEDCYVKCYPFEFCLTCGEKYYADGYCDRCGQKADMVKHCPRCNMDFRSGSMTDLSCPLCGEKCNFIERCDRCGYTHSYDGQCDHCGSKSFYDKCCYIYCDRYCYEYSGKCENAPCPDCKGIRREEVYGKSFDLSEFGYGEVETAKYITAVPVPVPVPAPAKAKKTCLSCP